MDQKYLSQFRDSLLAAGSAPTSTAQVNVSPTTAPQIANIQNMYKSNFGAGLASASLGAAGGAAQAQAGQEDANARMRLQEEEDKYKDLLQTEADKTDPTRYRAVIKDDGGYDFYDPEGSQIDIKQYSQATNKHITDVLKNSQNPEDRNFVNNYKNVQDLVEILAAGDEDAKKKFFKKDKIAKQQYEQLSTQLGRDADYKDVVRQFRSGYGKFFNEAPPAAGAPQQDTSMLGKIKSLFGG